jgi:hypothetical protein
VQVSSSSQLKCARTLSWDGGKREGVENRANTRTLDAQQVQQLNCFFHDHSNIYIHKGSSSLCVNNQRSLTAVAVKSSVLGLLFSLLDAATLLQGNYTAIACRLLCKASSRLDGKELTYCQAYVIAK